MTEQAPPHWTGAITVTLALAERLAAVYERLQQAHDAAGNGWQMSYCDGWEDCLSLLGLRLSPLVEGEGPGPAGEPCQAGWVLERVPERGA